MKNFKVILDRTYDKPTAYYLAGKKITVTGLSVFNNKMVRICDKEIDKIFRLGAVTADFIFYLDEEESDDTACVVMLNRNRALVSDNVFAVNELTSMVIENTGLLWISKAISRWQQELNGDDFVIL